jgi:hypothetical protein
LDLEVVEVFRRRSFLEEVVEVFRRRSFLEEVVVVFRRRSFLEEVVVVEVPFPPQEAVEEVEVVVPFPPQEAVEEVEEVEVEVLRLQDLLEGVSVQSFCAPNWLVGVGK